MNKNDIITLEITGMTAEGNGVGRHQGIAVFVPFTAVGDVIDAKITKLAKSYSYGIIQNIITPSENRIQNSCSAFGKCGGCSFRHISYEAELEIKDGFVRDAFKRIGKLDVSFKKILGCDSPENYRNKAQYPVSEQDGKAVCGFFSKRSHRVVPIERCALSPKIFSKITDLVSKKINELKISCYNEEKNSGLLKHIYLRRGFHTGEIMVCFVVTKWCENELAPIVKALENSFPEIKSIVMNLNPEITNVILGKKIRTLSGSDTISDFMCGNKIVLSPLSFYQVNTKQAERLYEIAGDFAGLSGNETVLDLYCGAGTIGLSMSVKAKKILGVEVIPEAVENAKSNAAKNGISNAEFICGDAGTTAKILADSKEIPDVIIVDPPRKGCDRDNLNAMIKMNPKKIVMVSCDPATAARDCAILCENGYSAAQAQAVDMFPRTTHVETVVLITRNGAGNA